MLEMPCYIHCVNFEFVSRINQYFIALTLLLVNEYIILDKSDNVGGRTFTVYAKLAEMPLLTSKDLTAAKKTHSLGFDLMQEIITGLRVQSLTN